MNKSELVSTIIITFNPQIERIRFQISRLLLQTNTVIIVDNNSSNIEELEQILVKFNPEKVHIVKNQNNEGLGYAQNVGIKKAIELGAAKVLLMDDDSTIEDNFVGELLKAEQELIDKGEKIGAIGPVYFNKETNEQYPVTKYIGPFIQRKLPKNTPVKASFLISSGTLISTDVLKDVGMMNEELFIDYIDVDWSFRARKMGYNLYVAPFAKMNHVIGEKRLSVLGRKVSYHAPLRKYYLFRNSIYMIKNPNISLGYKIREIVFNFVRFFVYLIYSENKKAFVKYSLHGLRDGFRGKTGKCTHQF
ncbi:MAG: rhamnosyltransferase [Porphyromonadaceae bacterium]|nr:rhamnosyltransferase [Porphyromonadaceae bacterium]